MKRFNNKIYQFKPRAQSLHVSWSELDETLLNKAASISMEDLLVSYASNQNIKDNIDELAKELIEKEKEKDFEKINNGYYGE